MTRCGRVGCVADTSGNARRLLVAPLTPVGPMQSVLDFIDRYAIDPQIYIVAPHADGKQRFELYWERDKSPTRWRFRLIGNGEWIRLSTPMLATVLRQKGADMERLEFQLRSIALTQVVFAETLTEEARRLFGSRCVDQAVEDHHVFLEQIQSAVGRFARRRLTALPGGGQGSKKRAGQLFLVADE